MVPFLDQDEEEALSPSSSLEGSLPASPSPTFSSPSPYQTLSSSPLTSSFTPPASPLSSSPSSLFLGAKVGADGLSFPWLGAAELLYAHIGADAGKGELAVWVCVEMKGRCVVWRHVSSYYAAFHLPWKSAPGATLCPG